jgi:hypothetical protein
MPGLVAGARRAREALSACGDAPAAGRCVVRRPAQTTACRALGSGEFSATSRRAAALPVVTCIDPRPSSSSVTPAPYRALLACVRQHDRARVRYDPGQVRPGRLLAQLARAWPDRTVAVAVKRIPEARHLARDLQRYLPQVNVLSISSS